MIMIFLFYELEPLIVYMDYKAKPWWCPRWFLRFLYLFGCDNSLYRSRNFRLSNFLKHLTKGIKILDYRTKYEDYNLHISINGTDQMNSLVSAIIYKYYIKERKLFIIDFLKDKNPNYNYTIHSLDELENMFSEL